jgi:hypothetical protein
MRWWRRLMQLQPPRPQPPQLSLLGGITTGEVDIRLVLEVASSCKVGSVLGWEEGEMMVTIRLVGRLRVASASTAVSMGASPWERWSAGWTVSCWGRSSCRGQ